MKRESVVFLSTAVLSLAFFLPEGVHALSAKASPDMQATSSTAGQGAASQMVAAQATLVKAVDARKTKPGQEFQASLVDKVRLRNGTELPRGTELIGKVTDDQMRTNGTSRLALRFTQAKLKDGKVVPIKATIMNIFSVNNPNGEDDLSQNIWTPQTLQVDQENALSGVDMHSKIADRNSAVFVSTKRDDVKLPEGYGIELAIAAGSGSHLMENDSNGGA